MKKSLLFTLAFIVSAVSAWADAPFRNQRYDVFKVLPVTEQSIVFMGNSITNMHDWFEAFDNPNVINRGCSGAVSSELIDNLESVLPGHPKKIFMMIGTNDLGSKGLNTAAQVAAKVRTALKKCKTESPKTELYVQSILPSNSGIRTLEVEKESNDSIKKICGEYGATYVDLFDDLMGITTGALSADNLHLKASGYRIWCKKIEQYVGSKCVYEDSYTDINGNIGGVHGMRCTYFGMSPVKADDVLLIGDATVNCGEWNELLGTANLKKRSTGWGGQGIAISTMQSMLPAIFEGNGNKVAPKKILIELGYNEAAGKTDADAAIATYKTFLEAVRAKAPNTPIVLLAVYPSNTANINTTYIEPFNEKLKALAEATENVTYEEGTYTELVKDGVANTDYFSGAFLYGKGYVKMAQVIAKHVEGATAITDAEAAKRLATFNARTSLSKAIQTAEAFQQGENVGNGVGQYKKDKVAPLTQTIEEGYALLTKEGATDEEFSSKATSFTAAIQAILPSINMPEVSEEGGEEHWYQLYTPNRNNRYTTSQGAGNTLIGGDNTKLKNTMWKFVKRTDGSLDIVNRKDGSYINPSATNNTALSTSATSPSAGWTLSYSDAVGTFIISSNTVQINQTNKNNALYNWGGGSNRSDTGCQFAIVDAPDFEDVDVEPFCGEYEISMENGNFVNPGTGTNSSFPDGYVIAKSWQSTSTLPQITFSTTANNMMPSEIYKGNYLMLHPGSNGCTYTLTVNSPCIITGYSFTYSAQSNATITIGEQTYNATTEDQTASVEGLNSSTTSFVVGGTNSTGKGVILKDFIVKIQTEDYQPGGQTAIGTIVDEAHTPATTYYDVQGRRVVKPTKGIYLTNKGQKVIIK